MRAEFFLANLDVIRRVAAAIARRRRLTVGEQAEFTSEVLFRLVRNDYAVLSKFRGQSSLATFLKPVIDRMCLDMRVANWGKWRPSSRSRRLGKIAVTLERLTMREGLTFDEACATLEINHRLHIDSKTRDAVQAGAREGGRRRPVSDDVLANRHAPDPPPDDGVFGNEECRVLDDATRALAALVRSLSHEDRRLLQLFYRDGHSVAAISRQLACDQKSLYRRFEMLRSRLRAGLESAGIDASAVIPLIGRRAITPSGVFDLPSQHPPGAAVDAPAIEPPSVAGRLDFSHASSCAAAPTECDIGSAFA